VVDVSNNRKISNKLLVHFSLRFDLPISLYK